MENNNMFTMSKDTVRPFSDVLNLFRKSKSTLSGITVFLIRLNINGDLHDESHTWFIYDLYLTHRTQK